MTFLTKCLIFHLDDEDSPVHEAAQAVVGKTTLDVSPKLCDALNQNVS